MFFGGGNSGLGRAYLVHVPKWEWTRLPDSYDYREDSSCGRAGRYIVSAGGSGAANTLSCSTWKLSSGRRSTACRPCEVT